MSNSANFIQLKIALLGLVLVCTMQQACSPNYLLPNIIQDQVVFEPTNTLSSFNSTYTYPFPRTFFTSTPSILSSFDNYQISSFSKFNYNLSSSISGMLINFAFSSDDMVWSILRVKFWLMARTDLMYGKFVLQNFQTNTNQTYQVPIVPSFSSYVDSNIIHLNFITGLKASSATNSYTINVLNNGTTKSSFGVTVAPMGDTSITFIQVSYVIFNFKSSSFASGGGFLNYVNQIGSTYKKVHGSFAPIIYIIYGFSCIKISNLKSLDLEFYFDSDYVMQTFTGQKFDILGVTYLTIGQQPSKICQNCTNQWIYSTSCDASCPNNTYPYIGYANGGKSCLTCSPKLNETINQFNTQCICFEGFTRIGDVCLPSGTPLICGTNQVVSSGKCVCSDGFQNVNGSCITMCDINSIYNSTTKSCQCKFGYYLIQGVCGTCPADRTYNATFMACICGLFQVPNSVTGKCQCSTGYYNYLNNCVNVCPINTTLVNGICIVGNKCPTNQTISLNGTCQCIPNTYRVNGICTVCQTATYYNQGSQSCLPCPTNCQICVNATSCSKCYSQYVFDSGSNICALNLYNLSESKPSFTPGGVITNFGTNRTVPIQTPEQLASMVNVSFPNPDVQPNQIFYSQNPTNSSEFKVFFSYCGGLIPLSTYNATYTITDPSIGSQKMVVNYNPVETGLTN